MVDLLWHCGAVLSGFGISESVEFHVVVWVSFCVVLFGFCVGFVCGVFCFHRHLDILLTYSPTSGNSQSKTKRFVWPSELRARTAWAQKKRVLELTLHFALSPIQFQALLDRRPILPDPYSSRFGLRTGSTQGYWAGSLFHELECSICWTTTKDGDQKIYGMYGSLHSLGVLTLQQAGILEPGDGNTASRAGYFRHHGPMYDQLCGEFQGATMQYHKVSDEFQELV